MNKKKILFIENKAGVFYWDRITKYLSKDYEIHWIIQNHLYVPKFGFKNIINYPKQNNLKNIKNISRFKKIISADRGHNYYGQSTDHYHYYYKEIKKIISRVKPSLIIGEATLFHELIAIKIAKKLKIRFIFPSSARFLDHRTVFHKYDRQNYIMNKSKDGFLTNDELIKLKKNKKNKSYYYLNNSLMFYSKLVGIKIIALIAYMFGEKYNTHSPLDYLKFTFLRKFNYYLWKFFTLNTKKKLPLLLKKKILLYPMQLQPESSINVWGYPYADQIKIIKELSYRLKKIDYFLAVKPNPKFKYEINYKTFFEIKKLSNVILIPPKTEINYLLKKCKAVFSITGTIILECVIKNKKIFTTDISDFTNHKGITRVKSLIDLVNKLKNLKIKKKKKNITNQNFMIKKIFRYSFPYPFNLWRKQPFKVNPDPLIAKTIINIERNEKFY